jgi:hypothetical protein
MTSLGPKAATGIAGFRAAARFTKGLSQVAAMAG